MFDDPHEAQSKSNNKNRVVTITEYEWKFGEKATADIPAFYRGTFSADVAYDTFLRTDNFKKGFVLLNGFNLGRYWEAGPQKTLYVPRSLIKKGENEVIIFESDGLKGKPEIEFTDKPEY